MSNILYHGECPPDTPMISATYKFTSPVRLKIMNSLGIIKSFGFGIGDKIQVIEPAQEFCIPRFRRRDFIKMPDQHYIIDLPDYIPVKRIWD